MYGKKVIYLQNQKHLYYLIKKEKFIVLVVKHYEIIQQLNIMKE